MILASRDANNPSINVQQWSDSPSAVTHGDESSSSNQGNGFYGHVSIGHARDMQLIKVGVVSGHYRACYHFVISLSFASIGFNALGAKLASRLDY